jgi:hypothetical protein
MCGCELLDARGKIINKPGKPQEEVCVPCQRGIAWRTVAIRHLHHHNVELTKAMEEKAGWEREAARIEAEAMRLRLELGDVLPDKLPTPPAFKKAFYKGIRR